MVHSLSVQGNNDILSTSKCWKRYIDYQLSNMTGGSLAIAGETN